MFEVFDRLASISLKLLAPFEEIVPFLTIVSGLHDIGGVYSASSRERAPA
jgi:hypothetical protein